MPVNGRNSCFYMDFPGGKSCCTSAACAAVITAKKATNGRSISAPNAWLNSAGPRKPIPLNDIKNSQNSLKKTISPKKPNFVNHR
jgi:hypothetical protein